MDWIYLLLIVLACYLIGSIPTGYILVKQLKGIDIRTVGSGSTGATNVKRILGNKFFFIVMLLDCLKGLFPVLFIKYLDYVPSMLPNIFYLAIIGGIMLVIGHSKSIYLGFTGGKSVATSVGVFLALSWQAALVAIVLWAVIVYLTKYVSLASIVASFSVPVLMWLFDQPVEYVVFTLLIGLYVSLYLHRENIQRLIAGTENKISFKEK